MKKRKSSEYVIRNKLHQGMSRGETLSQCARRLGISLGKAQELAGLREPAVRSDSLNCQALLGFLERFMVEDEGTVRLNGIPLLDKHTRAMHRWRHEGGNPSFFLVDAMLTHADMHINDFLNHCRANDINPWACGRAPDWEEDFSAV